jgi:hypothetical protein
VVRGEFDNPDYWEPAEARLYDSFVEDAATAERWDVDSLGTDQHLQALFDAALFDPEQSPEDRMAAKETILVG